MIIAPAGIQRVSVGGGGVGLAPYFPLSLPSLEEYYDGRTPALTLAHNAVVDPWVDLSGHSPTRDMGAASSIGTTGPKLQKTSNLSPKGLPQVRFNGTDNALSSGTINPFPAATNGHSFHSYGNWSTTSAPPAAFAGAVLWLTSLFGSVPKELGFQTVGTNKAYWRDSGGFHLDGASPTGVHLLSWVLTPPSTGVFYVDGVAVLTATYTLAGATADTTGFSDYINNNVPLNADMGFFFWCSAAHSAATIALVKLWASIYWGF